MLHDFIFYSYNNKNIDADCPRTTQTGQLVYRRYFYEVITSSLCYLAVFARQQSGRMLHKIEFTLYWKRQTVKRAFMCFGMWPNTRREIRLPVTKPGDVSSVPFWRPSFYKLLFGLPLLLTSIGKYSIFYLYFINKKDFIICSILNFLKFETTADIRMDSFIWKKSEIHE